MSLQCDYKYLEKRHEILKTDFRSLRDKYEDLKRKNRYLIKQISDEQQKLSSMELKLSKSRKKTPLELKCENQRKALASNYKKIDDLNKKLVRLAVKDQKNEENSVTIEELKSKLLEISEENKNLIIENETLINEKNEKQLVFDEVFKSMICYSRKMIILEDEKKKLSLENDHLRTVNENLELTVEDFENQEKQFKKKMMPPIEQAPNVYRDAKKGLKRKAMDEAYINKRRRQ